MTGIQSVDTRGIEQARQFLHVEQFVLNSGVGATGIERPRGTGPGHLVVATALSGLHNAVVLTEVEDPNVVYSRPVQQGAELVTLTVASGPIRSTNDGRRQRYSPGTLLVTGCANENEAQVLERMSRCLIRVHRADLLLSDTDIQRALAGELTWADWHREVMIHATRIAKRVKAGQQRPPDPTGVDRYAVGVVELLLRSALELPDIGEAPTAEDRRSRAERFIQQHLLDPDLSPETVAANQAISLRQLARAFADGPGVAATIARARLEQADRLLRDPSRATMSIIGIAHLCGFASAAHFSRAYKARHGITPSDARHAARWAPTPPQP